MPPQVLFGKVFTVTCADVLPEELEPLQRCLPGWIRDWLSTYLPTLGVEHPFFLSGSFIPQSCPHRCQFSFSVGGRHFQDATGQHFMDMAFALSNRLDVELKQFLQLRFSPCTYAWCLPQFNQFEFS
ncbi:E4 ORF2 [Bat mastadenovirus]|nr:E4 ORF2 [Bat mastadenovirus]